MDKAPIANAAPAAPGEDWPLIVLRHTHKMHGDPETVRQIVRCHALHRGVCDEFWFCTAGRPTPEAAAAEAAKIAALRPLCDEAGIALGYQQGLTLGHSASHDGEYRPGPGVQNFPEDAWQIDRDGNRIGILCPRSPEVLAWERAYAKAILSAAAPVSFWLDDDLRLGICKPDGCFCPRCLAAFNAQTGAAWSREALVAALFGDGASGEVRAAWSAFNGESIALFAAQVRAAADETGSPCRLGYQAVWADCTYTARDYAPLLGALSGPQGRSVGIRPGAGFFKEAEPRGMVRKCLSAAREAERSRASGLPVAAVCYEQDTYPRHSLHKSPGAIVTECALALASGCDSLSLYWFPAERPFEPDEYARFLDAVAAARPYFARLAASARRTRLGGLARHVGPLSGEPGFDLRRETDFDMACAGIPVTVAEGAPSAFYLADGDAGGTPPGPVLSVAGLGQYPLASQRREFLDALDAATGGAFPARIDECRPLRILPRILPGGALQSVTLLNLSIGETGPLTLRARNPVSAAPRLQTPAMAAPAPLAAATGARPGELVVAIGNLLPWQIATVFFD
ncbi:MAG: hypothetical protein IJS46_02710 [Kiritimatiellae bacterium]|nr:hypothetical protein [Kiritimatiellia bacterium]